MICILVKIAINKWGESKNITNNILNKIFEDSMHNNGWKNKNPKKEQSYYLAISTMILFCKRIVLIVLIRFVITKDHSILFKFY